MTNAELNELIITKLGTHTYIDGTMNALRFHYHGNTYRVNTDLFVEKVDGLGDDARQLEKLLRGEQWDGTGLPPVGTECEIIINGGQLGGCEVLFVGESVLVWAQKSTHQEGSGYHRYMKFRPLRTERDKAIEQMLSTVTNYNNTSVIHAAGQIYDAIIAGKIDGLGKVG